MVFSMGHYLVSKRTVNYNQKMSFVYHFQQGKLLSSSEEVRSFDQITLGLPIGTYTTFRTYNGGKNTIGTRDHLRRLSSIEPEIEQIRALIRKVISETTGSEFKLRLHRVPNAELDLYILIEKFDDIPPDIRENGIIVDLSEIKRESPTLKSTNFIGQSQDKRIENRASGIYESLIVVNGKVREGFTSNFFYVVDDVLFTAKLNVLKGVTRSRILQLAKQQHIKVGYKALNLDQLPDINEAFICSSSRGILFIREIKGQENKMMRPGAITRSLEEAYHDHESALLESI